MTKDDLLNTICVAALNGLLGMFVGTGFSKAFSDGKNYIAYSWRELLTECCVRLGVDKRVLESQCSCPELATKICEEYATKKSQDYDTALNELKKIVGELTNVSLKDEECKPYREWFESIPTNWIITTNYDSIIESVVGNRAFPILNNECFIKLKSMIPIFHIHGSCTIPEGIVISYEDYIRMFRPDDYRQARLPMLIKESCVLMIGYGLGDTNVITAMDWAKNVYKTTARYKIELPTIQLLYTKGEKSKENPYTSRSGLVIYEIDSIESFFSDLCDCMEKCKSDHSLKIVSINKRMNMALGAEKSEMIKFGENQEYRLNHWISFFEELEPWYWYADYGLFHMAVAAIEKQKELSFTSGNFRAYANILEIILDIFQHISLNRIRNNVFEELVEGLVFAGFHVNLKGEHVLGYAFEATDIWMKRKNDIPKDVIARIDKMISRKGEHDYNSNILNKLLKEVDRKSE